MTRLMRGIAGLLAADAGFTAASPGGLAAVLAPESVLGYPVTTYLMAGGSGAMTFDTAGPQRRRIQFDFHGKRAADVSGARDALRQVLNGFSGALPNGFVVTGLWLLQEMDFFDNEPRQFRAMAEYYATFNYQDGSTDVFTSTNTGPSLMAGTSVSQGMAVAVLSGSGVPADASDTALPAIGVATAGALSGANLAIQYSGPVTFTGWNFTTGLPVFVGANGVLSQTAPTSGYLQVVGYPISSTVLLIDIQEPITL